MLHWNADPAAFSLGPVSVRWYGIFFAVAFWQGLVFMRRAYARAGYDPGEADRLFGYIVIGVVVGARLGHCLIYEPAFYLSRPLEILKIWEGGLASHGGTAGLVFGAWLFFKRSGRADPFWLLDRTILHILQVVPEGYSLRVLFHYPYFCLYNFTQETLA